MDKMLDYMARESIKDGVERVAQGTDMSEYATEEDVEMATTVLNELMKQMTDEKEETSSVEEDAIYILNNLAYYILAAITFMNMYNELLEDSDEDS